MLTIETIETSQLNEVAPLWYELNAHHRARAPQFREYYSARTWDERRTELMAKALVGPMKILVARDETNNIVAYAIATVSPEGIGELDSLFVSESLRNAGIGQKLVSNTFGWMDEQGAPRKRVVVYAGNEQVLRFYTRFGLVPRQIVLEQPE